MKKPSYRVYSSTVLTVLANSTSQETIAITGMKDFQLSHVRVFTADYTQLITLRFQDTTSNENWQNRAFHISSLTINQGIIPFNRLLKINTEILIEVNNLTGVNRVVQIAFIGYDNEIVLSPAVIK